MRHGDLVSHHHDVNDGRSKGTSLLAHTISLSCCSRRCWRLGEVALEELGQQLGRAVHRLRPVHLLLEEPTAAPVEESLRGRRHVNCETKAAVDGTAHRELALAPGRRSFVGRRRLQEKQHRFDGLVPSLVTRLALGACSLARLLGGRFDIARGLGACAKRGLAPSGAATRELQWRRRGRREVAQPGAAPFCFGN